MNPSDPQPSPLPPLSSDLGPPHEGTPPGDDASGEAPDDEGRPPRIEGYRLIDPIGAGGMGTVWRALQLSTRREVAVKVLRVSGFHRHRDRIRARFEREVELASQLNHPGIVTVYHGDLDRDAYFFAMELVRGQPLNEYIQRHDLTINDKIQLIERICEAVQYAHQRGVIHRDLKPSNILVTESGQPKVLDFGLAKAVSDVDQAGTPPEVGKLGGVSIDGGVIGTMAYMAPEQAEGRASEADAAADVYSLGVILYQMLTGQLPHAPTGTMFEQQRRVIEATPPNPRALNDAIPAELEAVMLKALAKREADRYVAAGELGEDLRRYRDGEPLRARPLTLGYILRKRLAKHRGKVALLVALTLLLTGVAVASYVKVTHERNRAQQAADEANRALYHNRITLAQAELNNGRIAQAVGQLDLCPLHLRHWEWRRLRFLADQSQSTIDLQSTRLVTGLRAHDGALLIVDPYTMVLQTRDLAHPPGAGQLQSTLSLLTTGEQAPPNAGVTLSPDGTLIVMATDHAVHIFTTGDGTPRQTLAFDGLKPSRVCFSPDNRSLLTVTRTQLTSWDLATASLRWTLPMDDFVTTLAISPDGRIAVAAADHVLVREGDTGQLLATLDGEAQVNHLDWSDDGRRLVVTDRGGCSVWDAVSMRRLHRLVAEHARPSLAQFSPDARLIAVAGQTGSIDIWDAALGAPIKPLRGHQGSVHWLAFTSDRRLLSRSYGGEIKTWDLAQPAEGVLHLPLSDSTQLIDVAPLLTGRQFLFSTDDGRVHRWDPIADEHAPLLSQPGTHLPMAVAPDGQRVVTGNSSGTVQVWDAATGTPLQSAKYHDLPVHEVIWSPCGRWIVSIGEGDSALIVADATNLTILATWPHHRLAAFAPQGNRLAAYNPKAKVLGLWRTGTWQHEFALPDSEGYNLHAAISPDGRWLAASGQDIVGIWDLRTRQRVSSFRPFAMRAIPLIAFSRDSRRLLTAYNTVKIWDIPSMTQLLELHPPRPTIITAATFAGDDQWIVAGAHDGVMVWTDGFETNR